MKLKPSWVPHPFLHSHKASMNMRLCQLFRGRYKGILHDSKVNNFKLNISLLKASLMAQTVKNLPAMRETWVWPLGWEDPLEEGMATHSIILAWGIPKDRSARRLQSMESQRVGHDWATKNACMLLKLSFDHPNTRLFPEISSPNFAASASFSTFLSLYISFKEPPQTTLLRSGC